MSYIALMGVVLACSRLRDSGEKSFSKKKCEKRAYGVHLRTKIIENKIQFEVQKLDYPCRNLVI